MQLTRATIGKGGTRDIERTRTHERNTARGGIIRHTTRDIQGRTGASREHTRTTTRGNGNETCNGVVAADRSDVTEVLYHRGRVTTETGNRERIGYRDVVEQLNLSAPTTRTEDDRGGTGT